MVPKTIDFRPFPTTLKAILKGKHLILMRSGMSVLFRQLRFGEFFRFRSGQAVLKPFDWFDHFGRLRVGKLTTGKLMASGYEG
jgi:hypothetical protein